MSSDLFPGSGSFEGSILVSEPKPRKKAPLGWNLAFIKGWELGRGEYGDFVKFSLSINAGEEGEALLSIFASYKLSPAYGQVRESKLFTLVKTLLQKDLRINEKIELDDCIHRPLQVFVTDEPDTGFQRITEIKPVQRYVDSLSEAIKKGKNK